MRARRVSLDLLQGFHLRHLVWLWQWVEAEGWADRSKEIWSSDVKRENEGGTCSGATTSGLSIGRSGSCRVVSGVRCLDTAFARSGWCVNHHSFIPSSILPLSPLILPASLTASTTDATTVHNLNGTADRFYPSHPFPPSFISFPRNESRRTPHPSRTALPPSQHFPWRNTSTLDTTFFQSTKMRLPFVRASASKSFPEMTFMATAGGRCVRSLLRLARTDSVALRLARVFFLQPSPVLMAFSRHARTFYVSFIHTPSLTSLLFCANVMGHALMELLFPL